MKDKLKKIFTTALISTATLSIIGCATPNNKLAKNIDKGMADFVSSINNLDYVDPTSSNQTNNIGKIIETANVANDEYLTQTLEELDIENSIVTPSKRENDFKLYILSEKPFISFTSNDNSASINMQLNFSTDKISNTSYDINSKINDLILKRSVLMIYVNEIYNNRVNLSNENRVAINAYVNVIKENASFLNGNRGMVKNQLTLANDLISTNSNNNLVNYYIIKSGEALETRLNKIDSTISAIDSIIKIIENNLSESSIYYNSNLSLSYENIFETIKNNSSNSTAENKELADNILNSINFSNHIETNNISNSTTNNQTTNNQTTNNQTTNDLKSRQLINNNQNSNSCTNSENCNPSSINNQNKNLTNNNTLNNINNSQKSMQTQNKYQSKNNLKTSNLQNIQNEKNANYNDFNKNNDSNNNNNDNLSKIHTPATLDIPRNIQNNKQSNSAIFSNKPQTKLNEKNNYISQRSNNTHRQDSKNKKIYESNENIKRVPYIKNFD